MKKEILDQIRLELQSGVYQHKRYAYKRDGNYYCFVGVLLDVYRKQKGHGEDYFWKRSTDRYSPNVIDGHFSWIGFCEWSGLSNTMISNCKLINDGADSYDACLSYLESEVIL